MKHLFLIHSSITFYISLSVIKKLNLQKENVILLSRRHYRNTINNCDFCCIDIDQWPLFPHPLSIRSIIYSGKHIKLIDEQITNLVRSESYIYYTPSVTSFNDQVFITHRQCKGYHFIEEGIANYRINLYFEPAIQRSLLVRILSGFFNLLNNRLELNNAFLGTYNKSKYRPSYFYLDCTYHKEESPSNTVLVPLFKEPQNNILDYTHKKVFILSSLVESRVCSINNFTKAIQYLFTKLNKDDDLYIKFHPAQSETVKRIIADTANELSINIKVIDNSLPFEQIILLSDFLTLYGFESSLLFYSKILNTTCKQYSLTNYLTSIDPKYKDFIHRFPSIVLIKDSL